MVLGVVRSQEELEAALRGGASSVTVHKETRGLSVQWDKPLEVVVEGRARHVEGPHSVLVAPGGSVGQVVSAKELMVFRGASAGTAQSCSKVWVQGHLGRAQGAVLEVDAGTVSHADSCRVALAGGATVGTLGSCSGTVAGSYVNEARGSRLRMSEQAEIGHACRTVVEELEAGCRIGVLTGPGAAVGHMYAGSVIGSLTRHAEVGVVRDGATIRMADETATILSASPQACLGIIRCQVPGLWTQASTGEGGNLPDSPVSCRLCPSACRHPSWLQGTWSQPGSAAP